MFKCPIRAGLIESLQTKVQQYPTIDNAFEHVEPLILEAFGAQRLSIFQRRSHHKDLVSRYKTGNDIREIKLAINTQSIAGYVAMAQQAVRINNPYNEKALNKVHNKLRFEQKFDRLRHLRTDNILCVPIKYKGVLLGVMELMNKELDEFDDADEDLASKVSELIGEAYRYELGGTARPFDYLEYNAGLATEVLSKISINAGISDVIHQLGTDHDIPEARIHEALSVYFQVPFINYFPNDYQLAQRNVKLSKSYLKRNHIALLKDTLDRLVVVMYEPNNTSLLMEVENALGTDDYQLAFSLPKQILQYLGESNKQTTLSKIDKIIDEIDVKEENSKSNELAPEGESAIARLVSNVLFEAKRLGASDIHIDPEYKRPTLVRMRVDGVVRDINEIPEIHHNAVVARIKIMSGLNIAEKRLPQDGKLTFTVAQQNIEVRVATIPTVVGEGIVLRVLAGHDAMPIEKINLAKHNLDALEQMVMMPHGILLVVGPTGSGKTTTLHAILGFINTPDKKIWTAEDPVEITQYRLQQVQVNPKIGFTFAKALRAFLRADPDVILIGEMRDKETASAGIEASLTGHLVLSTLHTNSAPETITRLLDLGMDPVNFSDACVGILAQRLIRTLCSNCKEKYTPTETEIAFLHRHYGEEYLDELGLTPQTQLYRPKGCKDCDSTGYKGRTGVHELLTMTPDLRALVYKGASNTEIKKQAMQDGMRTLTQDAIFKVLKGDSDLAQVQIISGSGIKSNSNE
ncbi:MAG: type II secretory ATPase GspE/PulE/Tfp pilus assembly ATPase PilB-like protein [Glaciecola sp.]|jgi:type II secretory ATPase GspE/PulE/Tfp pilus assembly ATPase PilB-like protein